MKLILLIASLLIFSFVSSKVIEIKKPIARAIADEDLALELKFYGTCQEFRARVLDTVRISRNQSCLPIQVNVNNNPDVDDLHAHFFCTNIGDGKSIAHFVEIFAGTDDSAPYHNFVLSLIPSNPFRVLTARTSLARRPNCHITHDYCNSTNAVVDSCSTNKVETRKRKRSEYIISHDRIYITANSLVSADCKDNTGCCAYIAPENHGGICNHFGSRDLLSFDEHRNKYNYDGHRDGDRHDNDRDGNRHDNDYNRDGDRHDNDRDGNRHDNDYNRDGNRHGDDHRDGRPGFPHGGPRPGFPHGRPGNDKKSEEVKPAQAKQETEEEPEEKK